MRLIAYLQELSPESSQLPVKTLEKKLFNKHKIGRTSVSYSWGKRNEFGDQISYVKRLHSSKEFSSRRRVTHLPQKVLP
jgi:hypothetical protein